MTLVCEPVGSLFKQIPTVPKLVQGDGSRKEGSYYFHAKNLSLLWKCLTLQVGFIIGYLQCFGKVLFTCFLARQLFLPTVVLIRLDVILDAATLPAYFLSTGSTK